MGNDNKINSMVPAVNNVHKEVSMLLENELNKIAMGETREPFDLEKEFSKTKSNTVSFMWQHLWSRLLICLGVVFVITLILGIFVTNSNKRIAVEVKEFESLNLTTLLNKVSDLDAKIQECENNKKTLTEQRNDEIEKIEAKHATALKNLAKMNIKKRSVKIQNEQQIEQEYKADLASLEKYNKLIAACNDELKMYNEQRNEFDASRVQEAERQKAILNSERFLHEKEKTKLVQDYEAKLEDSRNLLKKTQAEDLKRQENLLAFTINQYDPPIPKDTEIQGLLKAAKNYSETYTGRVYDDAEIPILEGASSDYIEVFETQKDLYDAVEKLSNIFDQLPFNEKNAVLTYIKAIKKYAYTAANQLSVAGASEVNRIISQLNEIDSMYNDVSENLDELLETICSEQLGSKKVDGIIASQNEYDSNIYIRKDSRSIFTNPEYSDCDIPFKLWRGKEQVAIGNISLQDDKYVFSNVSYGGGYKIKIGDRIILGEPKKRQ